MIRVMLVDDDKDSAEALRKNIDGQGGIQVAAVLDSGEQAVARCLEINPDVVILDAKMPGISGIEACRRIKMTAPHIKVLILTFYQEKQNETNAIKYGCDGYLYKGHKSEALISVIRQAKSGFKIFDSGVRDTIQSQMTTNASNDVVAEQLKLLTDREIDIVRLITSGKKDNEISKELCVSEGYIRNQLVVIREKLSLRNSKELAVWGARAGL